MTTHLVTGGCGFVGRNMVQRLYNTTTDRVLLIDDLSVGTHPDTWALGKAKHLARPERSRRKGLQIYGGGRVLFM